MKHFLWYTPNKDYVELHWWNADGYPMADRLYRNNDYDDDQMCFMLDYFI